MTEKLVHMENFGIRPISSKPMHSFKVYEIILVF